MGGQVEYLLTMADSGKILPYLRPPLIPSLNLTAILKKETPPPRGKTKIFYKHICSCGVKWNTFWQWSISKKKKPAYLCRTGYKYINNRIIPGPMVLVCDLVLLSKYTYLAKVNRDFAFFFVWTYVKSASSPFAQSFSHAKAQQWSDDILP